MEKVQRLEPQDACSQWPASSRWSLHALEERQSYKSVQCGFESVNIFACISYTLRSRFRHIDFKVGSGFQFVASPWACSVFLLHLWVLDSILRKTDKGKLVPQRLETRAILRWWRCLVSSPRNIQLKMKYFADYCRHQQDVHGLSQCVFFFGVETYPPTIFVVAQRTVPSICSRQKWMIIWPV